MGSQGAVGKGGGGKEKGKPGRADPGAAAAAAAAAAVSADDDVGWLEPDETNKKTTFWLDVKLSQSKKNR